MGICNFVSLSNKLYRVRQEAERLISEEPELFFLPSGNEIYNEQQYREALNLKKKWFELYIFTSSYPFFILS